MIGYRSDINMSFTGGLSAADLRQIDAGTRLSMDIASGKKRKLDANGDSGDEMDSSAPPVHDLYRQRQQKKVSR